MALPLPHHDVIISRGIISKELYGLCLERWFADGIREWDIGFDAFFIETDAKFAYLPNIVNQLTYLDMAISYITHDTIKTWDLAGIEYFLCLYMNERLERAMLPLSRLLVTRILTYQ